MTKSMAFVRFSGRRRPVAGQVRPAEAGRPEGAGGGAAADAEQAEGRVPAAQGNAGAGQRGQPVACAPDDP